MKLREMLLDSLTNTCLFEMAFERKQAKDTVTTISPQLFNHLLKLFVFESPNTINHWFTEINSYLNRINQIYLKPNKTKPTANTLYQWLIDESAPHYSVAYIENTVRVMKRQDYQNVPLRDYDPEWILDKILGIIYVICQDIAENKFETIQDYV